MLAEPRPAGVDFVLLRMPYSTLTQPDLATGLLKACLVEADVTNRVIPANIAFAEEIGPVLHNLLFTAVPQTMIGEWTFSQALFPDFDPPAHDYLERVIAYFKVDHSLYWGELRYSYPYLNVHELLRKVRERATPFIDRIAEQVLEYSPRIVGCTSVFQQHCASLAVLKRIKALKPSTITMIGGSNCEGAMGRATYEQFPWLDYVVSGDADGFIGGLCKDILANDGVVPLRRLPLGVYSRASTFDPEALGRSNLLLQAIPTVATGCSFPPTSPPEQNQTPLRILTNEQSAEQQSAPIAIVGDMDRVPIPNYDDWFHALQSSKLGRFIYPSLPYMTSRGCWWGQKHHCTFCGISAEQMKYRAKSADVVMAELFAMKEKYGINSFQGTEYILDQHYFKTLIPQLHRLESHFRFEIKANVTIDQLRALRNAGVVEVQPGIESLQDDILRLFDKGTTAALNIRLLKAGVKHGMSIFWNMLHSVPGDRDEWYQEQAYLIPLLHHLQPPSAFAEIHYDRFSVYWKRPEHFGLQLVPAWGYQHVYPFAPEEVSQLAYFFDNVTAGEKLFAAADPHRPGLRALVLAVGEWQREFGRLKGSDRPVLFFEDREDHAIVTDTRAVAADKITELTGVGYHIMKACSDGGRTHTGLVRVLEEALGRCPDSNDISGALAALIDRKLLVVVSGRYLALPVVEPVRRYVVEECNDPELFPDIGLIHADRALSRATLAITCLRSPFDIPVSELYAARGKYVELESREIRSP